MTSCVTALRCLPLLGALPQGASSLLELGGMRPDNLPVAVSLFVKIRVPERDGAARTPFDGNSQVRFIPNDGRVAVEPHPNFFRLPLEVIQVSGRDVLHVLFLRQRPTSGVNQLEVVRMQATGCWYIR